MSQILISHFNHDITPDHQSEAHKNEKIHKICKKMRWINKAINRQIKAIPMNHNQTNKFIWEVRNSWCNNWRKEIRA